VCVCVCVCGGGGGINGKMNVVENSKEPDLWHFYFPCFGCLVIFFCSGGGGEYLTYSTKKEG